MKINSRMGTELMHPLPQTTMASARPCFRRISHALLYSLLLACVSAVDRPLEGRSLRCCTLIEPPVIFRDHTKRFGFNGIAMYYISLLQDKLGFNCSEFTEYVDPDDNTTSFTSFIYNMEQCTVNGEIRKQDPRCNCDIGVGGWAVNEDRKNRVDFIEPFVFDSYRVLTHIDNTHASTNSTFFLTSFSPDVWVSIFGLFVIFTLLKMLDERFAPRSNGFQPLPRDASRFRKIKHELLKSEVPYRLRHAIQSTLSKMIAQSSGLERGETKSTRHWTLNFIIGLCGLFLILSYEATMTASLVQESITSDFRSIQDIKLCRIPPKDVCMPDGDAVRTYWNIAVMPNECHSEEGQEGPTYVDTFQNLFTKATEKECKFVLAAGGTLQYAASTRYCGTLWTPGRPFYANGVSCVLPRNSSLTAAFDNATMQLRTEDVIPTMDSIANEGGNCESKFSTSLNFKRLQVFFYMAFGASFLIFLEMILDPQAPLKEGPSGTKDMANSVASDKRQEDDDGHVSAMEMGS